MKQLTRFQKIVGGVFVMGGFLLTHGTIANEIKVELPPYPERGLKRLVKIERLPRTEFPLIEEGAQVWDQNCKICHGTGNFGAPKITGSKFWSPRIEKGLTVLVEHAQNGFLSPSGGNMPARGGNDELTDIEVESAVRFMIYHSGGQDVATQDLN